VAVTEEEGAASKSPCADRTSSKMTCSVTFPWRSRCQKITPLRRVRQMPDTALQSVSPLLAKSYSPLGRPSIAPERLLQALLLQAFYSVGSERLLLEQLDYNLLFRWFVGLQADEAVWDVTVFTKNRDRAAGRRGGSGIFRTGPGVGLFLQPV
jgi:hypothetical protein